MKQRLEETDSSSISYKLFFFYVSCLFFPAASGGIKKSGKKFPASEMSVCPPRDSSLFCFLKHEPIKHKTSPSVDIIYSGKMIFNNRNVCRQSGPVDISKLSNGPNLRFHTVISVVVNTFVTQSYTLTKTFKFI